MCTGCSTDIFVIFFPFGAVQSDGPSFGEGEHQGGSNPSGVCPSTCCLRTLCLRQALGRTYHCSYVHCPPTYWTIYMPKLRPMHCFFLPASAIYPRPSRQAPCFVPFHFYDEATINKWFTLIKNKCQLL